MALYISVLEEAGHGEAALVAPSVPSKSFLRHSLLGSTLIGGCILIVGLLIVTKLDALVNMDVEANIEAHVSFGLHEITTKFVLALFWIKKKS